MNKLGITLFDCENIFVGWTEHKDYDVISSWIRALSPFEALKLAKYCITQKGLEGECAIQEIINFSTDVECRQRMLGKLNGNRS